MQRVIASSTLVFQFPDMTGVFQMVDIHASRVQLRPMITTILLLLLSFPGAKSVFKYDICFDHMNVLYRYHCRKERADYHVP